MATTQAGSCVVSPAHSPLPLCSTRNIPPAAPPVGLHAPLTPLNTPLSLAKHLTRYKPLSFFCILSLHFALHIGIQCHYAHWVVTASLCIFSSGIVPSAVDIHLLSSDAGASSLTPYDRSLQSHGQSSSPESTLAQRACAYALDDTVNNTDRRPRLAFDHSSPYAIWSCRRTIRLRN